jgi:membrane protein YfhO
MTGRAADSAMNGRSLSGLTIAACSVALLAPLLAPLLTGRVFVYNDLSSFHLPMRYLYQQALQTGDTVLWTPSIFAGLYLQGEGQVGLFHPFHQLLYRFLSLGTAFNLELIANYPAAFAGMFWFLRRLRISQAAALFGAMLFAFSGFNLLHHHHLNMVAVVAHLPWLLAAADVLIVDERRHARTLAFAAVAVILGSEFLLGFPQGVWWNAMTLAAFCLFRAGETRRWRQLLPCTLAVALAVLLGGIQLLPLADAAAHSTRMGLTREFGLNLSMHPYNLLQLWSPYFFERGAYSARDYMSFHELGVYSGAILPVAFSWVWIRRHALGERRALIAAVTVFAALSLILALGRYGGVAALLTHLPVLQSLRAPVRYIVLVQFALAILAAVTVDDLLAIADGRTAAPAGPMVALWIPALLGISTTLALNTQLLPYGRHTFASAAAAVPGVAIVAAVTLLVDLARRRIRWAIAALVVVTAADLAAWGILFIYREPARTIQELTRAIPAPPDDATDSYAAAPSRGPYHGDLLVMRGYRLTSGYVALVPATRHPLDSEMALRLAGTRWVFTPDGVRHPAAGGEARLRLLDEQGHASTGSAQLAVDRPGRLVAQVDSPGRRILAFTERFHDGWSATTDGAPVQMVRVEGDFLGCLVESGVYRVELRFVPRSFVYGSILSAIGAALLAGVLIARLR